MIAIAGVCPNQHDPTADISLGNFVEQFTGIGQLSALSVEGYELGGKMGQTSQPVDDQVSV